MPRATANDQGSVFDSGVAIGGTATLMLTDMVDSSRMTECLGDRKAFALMREHDAIITGQVLLHGGRVIDSRGDGFLLAFPSAEKALQSAMAIQRSLAARTRRQPDQPIRVRIGLHTGEVILDGQRIFGKSVILAARIAAQARAGEILVSSRVQCATSGLRGISFDGGRDTSLKGLSGSHRVYSALWKDTVLRILPARSSRRASAAH